LTEKAISKRKYDLKYQWFQKKTFLKVMQAVSALYLLSPKQE